jgi:hypothetical protein
MKSLIILNLALLLSGCALAQPPSTKFTVCASDAETGLPVTNALVRTGFKERADPWGMGVGKSTRVKKQVDSNGIIVFKGNTISEERGGVVFAKGYYSHRFGMRYKHNVALNRWEPWNPAFEVKMRPKKNPVSMVQKFQKWAVVPIFGEPVGYDLEVGDWVAPCGKGKHKDFIFVMELNRKSMSDAEASYILTFSNPMDGIQEYMPPKGLQSSYIFPYIAPTNGYKKSLYQHDINTPYGSSKTTEKEDINYIFRVRTKTDKDRNIISACYGRIEGELKISRKGQVELGYWFNPVPNERSLEWNGVNLLKNK